ncbi:hypothetical protein ACWEKT_18225 [Nocardia takedensis]|uniref:hypothetical protein n=1 Tax=Nocardia takedensis TaxID=259390 RepID=UPI0003035A5D|nr:hypothetical protein [Nocardia takedensis]
MELSALERQVAADRSVARSRTIEDELTLAATLVELAKALIATKTDAAARRDRTLESLAPAQEAVGLRLHWFANGNVSARSAGELQEALRIFEQATRLTNRRELAASTIRGACSVYLRAAQSDPAVAGMCADCLGKCGVWLGRLDQKAAVAATEDAARIRGELAAANPELAGKYLQSLSTLLRTLMVGRSRKQAISMYRERYAAFTSTAMAIRLRACGIRDLDLTPKSYNALVELECRTLEQAGRLTQQQIMHKSGDLSTVEEINWRLALVGLRPLVAGEDPDPPSAPVEIGTTFGALGVRCADKDAINLVRAAIVAAYAADDIELVDSGTYLTADEDDWVIGDAELNTSATLGDDVVLIELSYGGWVTVMSMNWELSPTGRHPLARRLSARWPVFTVTATANMSYELCRYDDGKATQYAALGRPAGQVGTDEPLAPLDFGMLAAYGAHFATETKVRSAFGNTQGFANLTYLPSGGIRQVRKTMPLIDHDHVLFFRKTGRP